MDVSKHLVRYRASLNAYVLILDPLNEVWMLDKREAMSNALRAKKDGISKFGVLS